MASQSKQRETLKLLNIVINLYFGSGPFMSLDLYKNALNQSLLREMFTLVLKKSKSELKYFSHVFNLYLTL